MAELGEEAPNANEHVSASVEEEGTWLVSGSNTAALVPGLGGDGRFAELGKEELKANEQTAVEAALADEEPGPEEGDKQGRRRRVGPGGGCIQVGLGDGCRQVKQGDGPSQVGPGAGRRELGLRRRRA